ncbi:MAG: IS91 family transposase [Sideroxyarcus sp.]|nr:IS91 family transposase [Sideroxyarcus sp.]
MIRLSSIIDTFEAEFLQQYGGKLLASQQRALFAIKNCRSAMSPKMQAVCGGCDEQVYLPHSCGHRNCPNCQAHESQRWIERQVQKLVPGDYFMITFTLPAELRPLARANGRVMYDLIMQSAWDTVRTFSQNDKALRGTPGAVTVLHTHSRRLDFHPHAHMVMPAAAIDGIQRLWRTKKARYLFNHKALAKVFRAKILDGIKQAGLNLPECYPEKWVVDVKNVGTGEKALVYLGRYLYRGVIREKDILACENGMVTFRYQDSKTKKMERKTVGGVEFLRLILQHVLPKGFRRARNFGFLHPNSKRLIHLVQVLLKLVAKPIVATLKRPALRCPCCGGQMKIVRTRIKALFARQFASGNLGQGAAGAEMAM